MMTRQDIKKVKQTKKWREAACSTRARGVYSAARTADPAATSHIHMHTTHRQEQEARGIYKPQKQARSAKSG